MRYIVPKTGKAVYGTYRLLPPHPNSSIREVDTLKIFTGTISVKISITTTFPPIYAQIVPPA